MIITKGRERGNVWKRGRATLSILKERENIELVLVLVQVPMVDHIGMYRKKEADMSMYIPVAKQDLVGK